MISPNIFYFLLWSLESISHIQIGMNQELKFDLKYFGFIVLLWNYYSKTK